jgi:hypothetical protein
MVLLSLALVVASVAFLVRSLGRKHDREDSEKP